MAGFDPALQNQALQTLGSQYRVPMPGEDPNAPPDYMAGIGAMNSGAPPVSPLEQGAQSVIDQQNAQYGVSPDMRGAPAPNSPPPAAQIQQSGMQAPIQGINPYAQQQPMQQPQGRGVGGMGLPSSPFKQSLTRAGMDAAEAGMGEQQAQAGLDQAVKQQQSGITAVQAAKSETSDKTAALYEQQRRRDAELQNNLADVQKRQNEAYKEVQQKQAEDDNWFEQHAEPKDRRTAGQRAGAAIAIGLADMASGLNRAFGGQGFRNTALDITEAGIARDMERQRAMFENKKTQAAARDSRWAQAMQQFGNEKDAALAFHTAGLQQMDHAIQAEQARGLSKEANASAEMLRGQLQQQIEQGKLQLNASRVDSAKQRMDQAVAGDAQYGISRASLAVQREAHALAAGKGKQQMVAGQDTPMGRKVARPDVFGQLAPAEHAKLLESENNTRDFIGAIDSLKQLRAEHGVAVGVPGTDAYNMAKTYMLDIQLAAKEQKKLGTWDRGSEAVLNAMTGDPNAWLVNRPEAQLDALATNARRAQAKAAQAAGLEVSPDELKLLHKTRTGAAK